MVYIGFGTNLGQASTGSLGTYPMEKQSLQRKSNNTAHDVSHCDFLCI